MTDNEYLDKLERLTVFQQYLRWFRPGKCRLCSKWTFYILKSENAHEQCWLDTK
jgi:hypothetical protein